MPKKTTASAFSKSTAVTPSDIEKHSVQSYFQPLVDKMKADSIMESPNTEYNYPIDIFTKWNRDCFYFCLKMKAGESNSHIVKEFDIMLVRLKYIGPNEYDFAYFRHTGKWHTVTTGLTLEECLEEMLSNPVYLHV